MTTRGATAAKDSVGDGMEFAKLWTAHAASNLSDGLRLAALPLLGASLTRSPAVVGGLWVAQHLPSLIFGLPAGALVDRVDRRRLLAGVHGIRAVVVALLAVTVWTGTVTLPVLYVVAAVLGAAETVFDTAAQALVADVVDDAGLDRANGLLEVGMLVGNQFVGPALGAVLFAAVASAPFILDAGVLVVAALAIVTLRPRPSTTEGDVLSILEPLRRQIAGGLAWLRREPLLRNVTLFSGFINFLIHATLSIHVLYALDVLRLPSSRYGLLLAAYALGGIVGGIIAGPLIGRFSRVRVIPPAITVAAVAVLTMGLTSSALVAGTMEVFSAIGATVWSVATLSLRQSRVPRHLFGRVAGVHRVVSLGGGALGAGAGAIIATAFGLRVPFLAAGVLLGVLAIAAMIVIRDDRSPANVGYSPTG